MSRWQVTVSTEQTKGDKIKISPQLSNFLPLSNIATSTTNLCCVGCSCRHADSMKSSTETLQQKVTCHLVSKNCPPNISGRDEELQLACRNRRAAQDLRNPQRSPSTITQLNNYIGCRRANDEEHFWKEAGEEVFQHDEDAQGGDGNEEPVNFEGEGKGDKGKARDLGANENAVPVG